jgi:hypothetical protein
MCDLKEIDHLIAALRRTRRHNAQDLEDLHWLQSRRRYVLAVLAARRAQKDKKVVRLDLWRSGGINMAETIADVA